jgi:hypothetical protein
VLKSRCWTFLTVDSAASVSAKADHTVICTWAVTPRGTAGQQFWGANPLLEAALRGRLGPAVMRPDPGGD